MNDEQPTLFLGNDLLGLSTLVFLVDPMTNTFWHRVIPNGNYHGQTEKLNQQIAGLHTVEFRTSPAAEQTLFMAFSLFCKDLSKAHISIYGYVDCINRCRVSVANTGMHAVMIESSSQLLPDTFVVNAKTGVFWRGNIVATSLKELDPTLASAESSRHAWNYIKNYPALLKKRFGETHVTVLKDRYGSLTRFYTETDRFVHELQLKEIDNKAEKMTLAEFLEQYCNKEDEK